MHLGLTRTALVGLLSGLCFGCQAISSQLGLGDEEGSSGSDEPSDEVDASADESQTKKKRRKRKRKPKPDVEPPPAPAPEVELDAALARAIVTVPAEPGVYRIDPFVLTLVADTLGRGDDLPFTRTGKKERRGGAPPSFEVGELPMPSLWRRLGLRPGDLVLSVEGAKPPGGEKLSELRKRIPREGTLSVEIQRSGATKTLRYRIEPGLAWTRYLEVEALRSFDPPPDNSPSGSASSSASSNGGGKSTPSKSSGGSSSPPAAVPVTCSGSTCRVPKAYFDSIAGSSSKASQQMRGKSVGTGYQITFVGPASRKAGFAVGEVITKVNGSSTKNQLAMLSLYGRLKSTKRFRVESTRGGRNRVTTILVE